MKSAICLFIFITSSCFGQTVAINSTDDFKNIRIEYYVPDYLNPKLMFYSDLHGNQVQDSIEINEFVRPKKYLLEKDFISEWKESHRQRRTERKVIKNHFKIKDYIIALAQVEKCCNQTADILVWKTQDTHLLLKTIHPYQIGGCLYCGVLLEEIKSDTLIFKISGGDGGDVYGSIEKYILAGDRLINIFKQTYKGNINENKYHMLYKNFYYDNNENVINSSVDYVNQENGRDIYAYLVGDSLDLGLITTTFMPRKPNQFKKVYIKNDSIKVGKIGRRIAIVFYNNNWYTTFLNQIIINK